MPKTIREMLRTPQAGDYWSASQGPGVFVADVKTCGSVIVITDWLQRGGHHPDYTKAREITRGDYHEMLDDFVGRGYRSREFTLLWVDIWRHEFHGNYAINLFGDDEDEDHSDYYENRWNTVH